MLRLSHEGYPITVLGPGRRYGIWVQGCARRCPGCASPGTWDYAGGREIAESDLVGRIVDTAQREGLSGLTISGGEPLDQQVAICEVIAGVKAAMGEGFDVLVFTGYPEEEIPSDAPIRAAADVLVCGPYMKDIPGWGPLVATGNQNLLLLTDLSRVKYDEQYLSGVPKMQTVSDGKEITLVGIPEAGTYDRLEELLSRKGITLGGNSWKS